MRTPHLVAALLSVLILAAGVVAGDRYATALEERYIHALAPQWFNQKSQGSALQRAAFRYHNLLPIYGASELEYLDPNHPSEIFKRYPTGFSVFAVGMTGALPINTLQDLAGVGSELRGKQVVISLSPDFPLSLLPPTGFYAHNFSPQHADETVFSTDLSYGLKQQIARRMLDYPSTLEDRPLLRFALERLADGSLPGEALYYAVFPLGQLENTVFRFQDHWEALNYIWQQPGLDPRVSSRRFTPNWDVLLEQAEVHYARASDSNPFGIENDAWKTTYQYLAAERKNTLPDTAFLQFVARSKGWTDLSLLLSELKELGAQPLILCAPFHGAYYDNLGVSRTARQVFYDKLRQVVATFGVPLLDFEEHDGDTNFLSDPLFHLSTVGWVYYDQALDAFFHKKLEPASPP